MPHKRALEEKTAEYNLLKTRSDSLETDLILYKNNNDQLLKDMETMKWIGTGFAIGGGVLIVMGSIVAGVYHEKAQDVLKRSYNYGTNMKDFNKYNNTVYAGYGMLAGGLALGVSGCVMAIFSHLAIGKINTPNAEISFGLTPNHASVEILF